MKEKLEAYCRETISNSEYSDAKLDWVFGAIDFACSTDLISVEEYKALLEEFRLTE